MISGGRVIALKEYRQFWVFIRAEYEDDQNEYSDLIRADVAIPDGNNTEELLAETTWECLSRWGLPDDATVFIVRFSKLTEHNAIGFIDTEVSKSYAPKNKEYHDSRVLPQYANLMEVIRQHQI